MVPTTNFILKWIRSETGAHKFDENLSEVSLITKDAFEPSLPLSVVVHIDYKKAPLVIQRFGDIKRLVEQTLDPMVSAYFKNVAQTRTLIQLLQERSKIQELAGEEMREKFRHYDLELEEVLIGTPTGGSDQRIEQILMQLRTRQIAEEAIETYVRQEKAAVQERLLREAEARARKQQSLTESEIAIAVQTNEGKAAYQRALQQAEQIRALAHAEADKTTRLGIAQAIATEEQVRAYGGPRLQVTHQVLTRLAEAIEKSAIPLVPRVVVGGGGNGADRAPNAFESLLTVLLSERLTDGNGGAAPASAEVEAVKAELRRAALPGRGAAA
jgi:uncharacterized membrane protein YqiK